MWQLNLAIILFHINTTKSFRIENIQDVSGNDIKVIKEPMRIFLPTKDNGGAIVRTIKNIKDIDDIFNLDDSTSDSFEVVSSEKDSSSKENNMKGRHVYRRLYDGTKKDYLNRHIQDPIPSDMTTTDEDTRVWKTAWKKRWDDMKKEALLFTNVSGGDMVNIAAARPWGRLCGDPMQHDVPQGVCTMPDECDSELRIFRGDFYCGSSHFVCCGVDTAGHDLNQAFDVSFAESSRLSTSSEETLKINRGSRENQRRKRERHKKELHKEKSRRKKQMKKKINNILIDLYRQISRAYRNSTDKKNKVANNLKALIFAMKQKLTKDRDMARHIYHKDVIIITKALDDKLNKIKELNYNFLTNETFKNIVTQKSTSLKGARMLLEAYPELIVFPELSKVAQLTVNEPNINAFRRFGGFDESKKDPYINKNYFEYDVEYGILNE